MPAAISKKQITRVKQHISEITEDFLAVEEPLEIRLTYGPLSNRITKNISVTMRTPGNDQELAAGFLFTEGIITSFKDITDIQHFESPFFQVKDENIVVASVRPETELKLEKLERNFYTTSSCGVCGKSSIDAVKVVSNAQISNASLTIKGSLLAELPIKLRNAQSVFESTGGLHASALFNANGDLLILKEDVGRHNALDKLIGEGIKNAEILFSNSVLLLSGRASFELIQKAAMAGIPIVVAVGAPSSLAVELAEEFKITLVGFLKKDGFNIYSKPERILNKS